MFLPEDNLTYPVLIDIKPVVAFFIIPAMPFMPLPQLMFCLKRVSSCSEKRQSLAVEVWIPRQRDWEVKLSYE
jgi:hypothetical protein